VVHFIVGAAVERYSVVNEVFSALKQLDVVVWVSREHQLADVSPDQLSEGYQVIFLGDDPLMGVWVDAWDDSKRKILAKILRFLHVPLKRCVIIGPDQIESASVLTALSSNINKLFAFGVLPKKLVDSLGTIEYVESIPLAKVISDPSLKEQVLHELWEHHIPTD